MLNINLIKQIKKYFDISIGESKKFLEKNNWNYNKTLKYIKSKTIKNIIFNFNFFSLLTIENYNKIFLIKIIFNSVIIKNSNIIENFKLTLKKKKLNKNIVKNEIFLLSIKLNDIILLKNILVFSNKNIFFYNHKNYIFCLINYKKNILNLCYQIIFNKINFINYKCKKSLINQIFIKNNILIKKLLNINLINFIFLINKNEYFYYE